jgi:hypothetical protein
MSYSLALDGVHTKACYISFPLSLRVFTSRARMTDLNHRDRSRKNSAEHLKRNTAVTFRRHYNRLIVLSERCAANLVVRRLSDGAAGLLSP